MQQDRTYIPSSSETAEVTGYRRSTGYFVPGVLRSPLLRTQTRWLLLPYYRSQGPEPVPGGTVFQDGNPVLDSSSVTTPGMDDQNRFEGCQPTYHSTSKYPQVLPACGKLSDLPLPFGLFTAPKEFTKTLAPVVLLLESWGIQIQATSIGFSVPALHYKPSRMRRELCSYQRHLGGRSIGTNVYFYPHNKWIFLASTSIYFNQ